MKCPYCGGEFEAVDLRTVGGGVSNVNHCTQCGGFWFDKLPDESFSPESVAQYDSPQPNYTLKAFNMSCPNDKTILEESNRTDGPAGSRWWFCNDCRGVFYPKGQLALMTQFHNRPGVAAPAKAGMGARTQAAVAISLVFGLVVLTLGTLSRSNLSLQAAGTQPLPTAGPNIITLVLLALTYLAGTVLAVLGRRLPMIIMGWSVIVICLVGFSVLIFGP